MLADTPSRKIYHCSILIELFDHLFHEDLVQHILEVIPYGSLYSQFLRLCYNHPNGGITLVELFPVTRINPSICILFPACTAIVPFNLGLPFSVIPGQDHLQKWSYHGSHPFPMIRKIIHCVVFNKVIHIIHPSLSKPLLRTLPDDRLRIALGWYREFQ